MENHTPPNTIRNSIENNSTKLDRNEKITVSKGSEASSFQLLVREVDNFPDYSDRICHDSRVPLRVDRAQGRSSELA